MNRLGRFNAPDPLAGSITDPQSLNRYAYVLNDPCNLVDPLGLEQCTLNIAIGKKAGLGVDELNAIQDQIKAIFAATSVGGDSVTVSFNFQGKPDYKLNLVNAGPKHGDLGHHRSFLFFQFAPVVHPNRIADDYRGQSAAAINRIIGTVAVHELVHRIAGIRDLPYDLNNPTDIMSSSEDPGVDYDRFVKDRLRLTPDQASKLFKRCKKRHPSGAGAGPEGATYSVVLYGLTVFFNEAGFPSGYQLSVIATYTYTVPSWIPRF